MKRVILGHSAVVYAKMAETIEMPFGLKTRMGPGNHVQIPHGNWQFGGRKAHCTYRDFLP